MLLKGAQIKGEDFNSQEILIQLSGVGDTFGECSEIAPKDSTDYTRCCNFVWEGNLSAEIGLLKMDTVTQTEWLILAIMPMYITQMSLLQKVVHRSGTYIVKIKHQNCLLQVNHVKVLCMKIIFSLSKNGFMPDLVNHHTRHRVCNISAVENFYWALLKPFVGSTVCKCSHQNDKTENMALSSKILHQSLCPSVMFDHCRY